MRGKMPTYESRPRRASFHEAHLRARFGHQTNNHHFPVISSVSSVSSLVTAGGGNAGVIKPMPSATAECRGQTGDEEEKGNGIM